MATCGKCITICNFVCTFILKIDPGTNQPPPSGSDKSCINPSLLIDNDDNQLIKDSAQLGYRNPPEVKFQVVPSNLKPVAELTGCPHVASDYKPPDQMWVPPTTSPSVSAAPSDQKFHPEVSSASALGQGQYGNMPSASEVQHHDTQLPNTPAYSTMAGGPKSLPSVGSSDGLESHHKYNRQKSTPTDGSLTGEMIASATTKSNQLSVSDHSPIKAAVPLTDQPTPEASQAPSTADSKFGKTNLNYLKNKLQHKKEVTQTVVQTDGTGAHPHSSGDYINADVVRQMVQDSTNKSTFGRPDLTSLRSRLEKTKEEREKEVVASSVNQAPDYHNLSEVSSYVLGNPMIINNLRGIKPKASPRTIPPASNNSHSASSFELWQCVHCQSVNEICHISCSHCKLPRGRLADRSTLCEFCQLLIFIPAKGEHTDVCCPRCKQVYETVL